MREAFSESLRQVLDASQQQARALNQEFVGTEHLALALLCVVDSEVCRVLTAQHISPGELKSDLLNVIPKGDEPPVITGALPLTPKVQRAINGAIVKTQAMRESRVTTRAVLLALLDEPQTALREALNRAGADLDELSRALSEKHSPEEN